MSVCMSIDQVDLVFGSRPKLAFSALLRGLSRDEIQKTTQQIVAVQQASFTVTKGEILVVMGLSGSGKSSLLRCLNGMNGRGVGVLRGQIRFRNPRTQKEIDLIQCSNTELREIRKFHISMVFQQFGLMPWRTVWENVAYPLQLQKRSKEDQEKIVSEKLDLVGLQSWKDRFPHELSGGMQQRVGLARAFASDASVLLMDEPFSALDPLHKKHLQDEILELQKKLKKTIVFVTHDLNEAVRIGTRIAIMDSGRILQIDTPERLFSNPSCQQVKEFTAQVELAPVARAGLGVRH